ncbi:NUDIX domain-containing protein [Indiicoccus explosivorum]|uniref:NUDIX domain-containing protein n=1 Tax=Indiicoccus explosivorum TaxID=1917864 RepID=UPI000B447D9F|nr:NUDIX domain-containing protein [Indiicoccus explosivorum]
METRRKVYAYITRENDKTQELLIFEYKGEPEQGVQVPGGTIGEDEMVIDALYRKVAEETGLAKEDLTFAGKLHKHMIFPKDSEKAYEHNIFHFEYTGESEEAWEHTEPGGKRVFQYRWKSVRDLPKLAKDQGDAVDML